jgi:hypothetical protein
MSAEIFIQVMRALPAVHSLTLSGTSPRVISDDGTLLPFCSHPTADTEPVILMPRLRHLSLSLQDLLEITLLDSLSARNESMLRSVQEYNAAHSSTVQPEVIELLSDLHIDAFGGLSTDPALLESRVNDLRLSGMHITIVDRPMPRLWQQLP